MGEVEVSLRSRPYHFIQHCELWRHLVASSAWGSRTRWASPVGRFLGGPVHAEL